MYDDLGIKKMSSISDDVCQNSRSDTIKHNMTVSANYSLSTGLCFASMPNVLKWAIPADYVPNLSIARIATRPSKYHWKKERPPVLKSMAALNREIDFIGGTSKCNTYIQYSGDSIVSSLTSSGCKTRMLRMGQPW